MLVYINTLCASGAMAQCLSTDNRDADSRFTGLLGAQRQTETNNEQMSSAPEVRRNANCCNAQTENLRAIAIEVKRHIDFVNINP